MLPCFFALIGWGTSACSCATLAGDQKPTGSAQTRAERGVCLPQPSLLILVKHVIQLGTPPAFTQALQTLGFSGRVNTACIERVNLTIRRGVAALARRTWATALQTPHLQAHLHWWQASSHFVRPHASLRVTVGQPSERGGKLRAQRYQQRTPAMAAGRTTRRWTAGEVLGYPLPSIPA